ncbi:hypothetical protein RZS08_17730, partial [Arthrospira platensis SPKY1]|nr:hypothetical protein [Arthrospira platensis SPKY1]
MIFTGTASTLMGLSKLLVDTIQSIMINKSAYLMAVSLFAGGLSLNAAAECCPADASAANGA